MVLYDASDQGVELRFEYDLKIIEGHHYLSVRTLVKQRWQLEHIEQSSLTGITATKGQRAAGHRRLDTYLTSPLSQGG